MIELEFSIMGREDPPERLQSILAEFEARTSIHVYLTQLDWEKGRNDLIRTGLYHHGVDVSEVGSTWLSDLIGMNALLPVTEQQVALLGGADAFVPAIWQGGLMAKDARVWSVPWTAEPKLMYYNRDLLHQAGVDEDSAFDDYAHIEHTLHALADSGVPKPATLMTQERYELLHNVISFIWAEGGALITADGRRTLFESPQAMQGMVKYFSLLRCMQPGESLEEGAADFQAGRAALIITGTYLLGIGGSAPEGLEGRLGMRPLPSAGFLGFSSLVIWNHTRKPQEAFELVKFLNSAEMQLRYDLWVSQLPTRLDALASPEVTGHPYYSVAAYAIRQGRAFPCVPLSGLVEDRLSLALMAIAREVHEKRSMGIEEIVAAHILPLARRLNITLNP
jgi:multiple sugar transport system substrate-binding protein